MLGYIWGAMLIVSLICSIYTGKMEELSSAALNGAAQAIELTLSLLGVMTLWSGLMKIADKGGITAILAKVFSPFLRILFPDYKPKSPTLKAICANMAANLLGLGNAATPFGIVAMKEMQKENKTPEIANRSMVMFVVLNTASIQLIPTTIAAMRASAGSKQPFDIIVAIWIVSFLSLFVGIITAKCFEAPVERRRLHSNRGGKNGNNR